jgi:hypothetical protein
MLLVVILKTVPSQATAQVPSFMGAFCGYLQFEPKTILINSYATICFPKFV